MSIFRLCFGGTFLRNTVNCMQTAFWHNPKRPEIEAYLYCCLLRQTYMI
jgi:hypothetical protein